MGGRVACGGYKKATSTVTAYVPMDKEEGLGPETRSARMSVAR